MPATSLLSHATALHLPAQSRAAAAPPVGKAQVLENYAQLPVHFEANQGQTDGQFQFLSPGPAYTLLLTADQAVLALHPSSDASVAQPGSAARAELHLQVLNANADVQPIGEQALPGKVNY